MIYYKPLKADESKYAKHLLWAGCGALMFNELVELEKKGLSEEEVKARNFRARLFGLVYEDLLDVWFRQMGYNVCNRDVRRGLYKGKRAAIDFIVKKGDRLYAVEAKCWPAFEEGRLKKLTLSNIERVKKELRTPFLEEDFVKGYTLDGRGINGKILVWWDFEETEAEGIKKGLKLHELLSLKRILKELKGKAKAESIIRKYKGWTDQLFNALLNSHT
jgi:hypothetical protein